MTAKEIKARLDVLRNEVRGFTDKAKADKRELNETEQPEVDKRLDEIEKLEKELPGVEGTERRAERLAAIEQRATAEQENRKAPAGDPGKQPQKAAEIEVRGQIPSARELRAFGDDRQVAARNAYTAGMYIAALVGNHNARQWCADHLDMRALGTLANSTGGFVTAPEQLSSAVIVYRNERGVFAREADNITMPDPVMTIPRYTGGVTLYPVTENNSSAVTESTPTFDAVTLVAKQWGGLVRMSNVINEDSIIDLGAYVAEKFGYGEADKQDECGFNGDGTSTYHTIQGLLAKAAAGSIYTAATGNTGFDTLDLADFEGCAGALPQRAGLMPKWYISKFGWANSMQRLADAGGGNTIEHLANGASQTRFLGYPVVWTDVLNKTSGAQASTKIAIFGDLRASAKLGTRRDMRLKVLNERYAELDQIGIYGTSRWDINVHEIGTSTVAGNYIVLKTPAS